MCTLISYYTTNTTKVLAPDTLTLYNTNTNTITLVLIDYTATAVTISYRNHITVFFLTTMLVR